jgi:hypothetical protein
VIGANTPFVGPIFYPPARTGVRIKADHEKWGAVVRQANIRAD